MDIIKRGCDKEFRHTCRYCKTTFLYNLKDVYVHTEVDIMPIKHVRYEGIFLREREYTEEHRFEHKRNSVDCPVCMRRLSVNFEE